MAGEEILRESRIRKVFSGSTVLVTGGTGFLGKLLVEKLLRSCPELRKLYLLVRPKKNKDVAMRLHEQFEEVLYDKLREENPSFMEKIGLVEGDIAVLGLGISEGDWRRLTDEVEIIFHGAATVRLDEPLKVAAEINVRGTSDLLELARACTRLKAMVHISTAYSNCPMSVIEERFYQSPLPAETLINLVQTLDETTLNKITPGLIGEYPNTYTYTKACAEDIVLKYSKELPLAVVRPSIVIATAKEPVPGWIDNVYGPTGVVLNAQLGLQRVFRCKPSAVLDLVPADMVVNCCIACAAAVTSSHPPPVYNYVSGPQQALTWERFMSSVRTYSLEVPSTHAKYYYLLVLTPSMMVYKLVALMLHWIPAYLGDAFLNIIGKKPMLRRVCKRIEKFSSCTSYFSLRQWKFSNANTQKLFDHLNEVDKQLFDFNIAGLNWNDCLKSYVHGIRVFLLKDSMDTVPDGKKKCFRLKMLHYVILMLMGFLILRLLWWLV